MRPSLFGALKARLANSYLALLFIVLAGLALVIPGLVIPTFAQIFVDDILVKGLQDWIRPLLLAMGGTVLIYGLLTWLRQTFLLRLETRLALSMSSKFFLHVFKLPIVFFSQRYAGEVGNRVLINDRVARLLSGEMATTILNVVLIAFYGLLMLQYDVVLTVLGISIALLNIIALKLVSRKRGRSQSGSLAGSGQDDGHCDGGLANHRNAQSHGG